MPTFHNLFAEQENGVVDTYRLLTIILREYREFGRVWLLRFLPVEQT